MSPGPLLLLAFLPACALARLVDGVKIDDSSGETGETHGHDTHDTEDSGIADPDRFLTGADWYRALSVPPERGWRWALDPDFRLSGYSVPGLLVLHEGAGYRMFLTDNREHGMIKMARSEDGLAWAVDPDPVLHPDLVGLDGYSLLDVSTLYLADGSYRLLVEAYWYGHGVSEILPVRTWDGERFEAETLETLEPSKSDFDVTSVLGPLWFPPAGAYLVYYVGDWVTPDGDGIRLARSTDGVVFEHVVTENVLDVGDVDPNPVRDEGGGIRLYHTGGRPGGGPSVASSDDGLAFEDHGPLVDFDASACDLGASERLCLLDPGFLRLPDDRLVLYFSEMRDTGDTLDFAIRRAFATD